MISSVGNSNLLSRRAKCAGLVVLVWSLVADRVTSKPVSWLPDAIKISVTRSNGSFILDLAASRHVLFAPSGHFKLGAVRNGVRLTTSCISYGASSTAVSNALQDLNPVHDLEAAVVFRQGDGSSAYNYGFSYEISLENQSLADSLEIDFVGSGVESGCTRLSTLSYWDDGSNWDVNTVPSALDEVVIPADAGFVGLTEDTVIAALEMNGGALVTHDSTCISGWSPPPGGTLASFGTRKCYRVFREAKSWAGAQRACAFAVGAREAGPRGGALRGALVTVQGLEENQWVQRLCRGGDCWVGMARNYNSREAGAGATDLEWADLEVGEDDSRYRSWARREPATFVSGEEGKNCVAVRSSGRFAAEQGEARWYTAECGLMKSFVCQAFGVSIPFSLTVSTELNLNGGYVIGAGRVISTTLAQVSGGSEVGLMDGATLVNSANGSMHWSASSVVGWGGVLLNKGTLRFAGSSSLEAKSDSQGMWADNAGAWPIVINEGGAMVFEADSVVHINWLLWNVGGSILVQGNVIFSGGGYSPSGNITVDNGAVANFSNGSFAMHQPEVFVVLLEADRKVDGQDVEFASERGGYYRLAFGGEETRCIGYHASDKILEEALEDLATVDAVAGVTVQRDGHGELGRWNFGYRHVVTFDGARALSDADTLTLSCVGSSTECGCVDITGAIDGPGGSRLGCGAATFGGKNTSTSATFDMFDCRIQATVDVSKILQGGETLVQGGGTLVFSGGGQYMSPSLLETDVEVHSTAEVLVPHWRARLMCKTVKITSGGTIWFSGVGWDSLDAILLLHEQPGSPGMTGAAAIYSPPDFNSSIRGDLTLESGGEIRLASKPSSTLNVIGSLTFAGGGLSGQGRVIVHRETSLITSSGDHNESISSLQYGVTLEMLGGGRWTAGNMTAKDGITVINRGRFEISGDGRRTFGGDRDETTMLLEFDGKSWFKNPLCHDRCSKPPMWGNAPGAMVLGASSSDVVLYATLMNEGTILVEDGGRQEWAGAGKGGGGGAIALLGSNSTLVISDGAFVLNATANVSGNGVLEFSSGKGHELSASVSPLVKVSGDGVVNFGGKQLSLGMGLTVTDNGAFNFSATTSSTSIYGNLSLDKSGLIRFPPPNTRVHESLLAVGGGVEAPWGSDEGDLDGGNGWGAASRSSVRVEGKFTWTGGTISGNARILCKSDSAWGGTSDTKTLLNSLHLVNMGDAVWSEGDVIVSHGATFINRGTLRLHDENELDLVPRIRTPRDGEHVFGKESRVATDFTASVAGAGFPLGGAANWAWEELSYDGLSYEYYDGSSYEYYDGLSYEYYDGLSYEYYDGLSYEYDPHE